MMMTMKDGRNAGGTDDGPDVLLMMKKMEEETGVNSGKRREREGEEGREANMKWAMDGSVANQ